ncbi:carboxysome shell protein [Marichromatium purpuratum 984]|uniref:Carboxysome shell protein n=1 Tax=Marichromatium purpuratum 984 TaxID=765910 RepID=W0E2V1_MARPU|nr:carboxysome peptide B [Marichromatium purpuratum]AHF05077.1 carboxysome shell protein [Marichromatium purpuratum 984]
MEIMQVERSLVCSRRIPGLESVSLRVLRGARGARAVAVDTLGARPGNWVFIISGSAARLAVGKSILTDLSIGGIIDHWETDAARPDPRLQRSC